MVFNCTFNNISGFVTVSFIGGGNQSTLEKITDLLQVTDKIYVASSTPRPSPIQTNKILSNRYVHFTL
jgi:hypothetical protein